MGLSPLGNKFLEAKQGAWGTWRTVAENTLCSADFASQILYLFQHPKTSESELTVCDLQFPN